MKRILALDGGGIRGLFSLQILKRIEQLFREARGRPELVLADEFDLFAGTSTGAIIATGLCWGMSVEQVEQLYLDHGRKMFTRSSWLFRWRAKYRAEILADVFRQLFAEDEAGEAPANLGSAMLRKLLLVVMRNASTRSPWPVTNNPAAKYNDRTLDGCNLNIPLWQLLRASTAAPTFFAPERIQLGDQDFLFVDGAITPFNNPALIAVLMATLPAYRIGWPASRDELLVVSIGTGGVPSRLPKKLPNRIHLLDQLLFVPSALLDSISAEQDMLCRVLGNCIHGEPLDSEIGDLKEPSLLSPSEEKFTYVRYDVRFDLWPEVAHLPSLLRAAIDDLTLIPHLQQIGRDYADQNVSAAHLIADAPKQATQGLPTSNS